MDIKAKMNRCRDCKWWERLYDDDDKEGAYTGICRHERLDVYDDHPDSAAALPDCEIYTGHDFGCVHFEVKDEPD